MKNRYIAFTVCLALVGTIACKKKKEEEPTPVEEIVAPTEVNLKQDFLTNYANIAHVSYYEAKTSADALKLAIDAFVATPNAANLTICKTAYETSRKAYLQTEAFRGVGGPIEDVEGFMNAWPLDEAYIDFVFNATNNKDTIKVDGKRNGIVNDLTKTIDKSTLATLNTLDGDANVSTGYHAIEFLLWGQDVSATTAGTRPYTDFLTTSAATAPNGARRGAYLKVCAELLVENLTSMVNAWKPGDASNYRAKTFLVANDTDSRLKTVVEGMTKMAKNEFSSQRILEALGTHDQENEHSCFSDLTKLDFQQDALGFENIVSGTFKSQTGAVAVTGTGLQKLVQSVATSKANTLDSANTALRTTTGLVYNTIARYDQIILVKDATNTDVKAVKTMADAWIGLSDALNLASQALGYGVVNVDEEK